MLVATGLVGTTVFYGVTRFGRVEAPVSQPAIASAPKQITALGRLEPGTEIIKLAAPLILDGDRVTQVLVKPGDRVKPGQVVAILDSRDRLQATLTEAQERVRVAQAKMAQVKAGDSKQNELVAQKSNIARWEAQLRTETIAREAEIARAEAELRNAERTYQRYQTLYAAGAEKAVNVDEKRERYETALAQVKQTKAQRETTVSTLREQIQQERSSLNTLREVRPVDVQAMQAEVESSLAGVKRAETELEQAYVRSPITGQILKVHARPGQKLDDNGIAELAQTQDMVVVAEVYQTDIEKIRVGQSATITGQAFTGTIQGSVYEVGLQVSRQNVFSTQPGENLDRRVVEVKIRLNPKDSQRVAGLTNLQVQAAIKL